MSLPTTPASTGVPFAAAHPVQQGHHPPTAPASMGAPFAAAYPVQQSHHPPAAPASTGAPFAAPYPVQQSHDPLEIPVHWFVFSDGTWIILKLAYTIRAILFFIPEITRSLLTWTINFYGSSYRFMDYSLAVSHTKKEWTPNHLFLNAYFHPCIGAPYSI